MESSYINFVKRNAMEIYGMNIVKRIQYYIYKRKEEAVKRYLKRESNYSYIANRREITEKLFGKDSLKAKKAMLDCYVVHLIQAHGEVYKGDIEKDFPLFN